MKLRFLSILTLMLLPCMLRAQTSSPVRTGDTIDVRIANVPAEEKTTFDASYTVDNDGNINLPYINQVKVGGLLPNQIQEAIQSRLIDAKIFTHPTITVQENQVRYVNINGSVRNPQRVPYTPDMTLMAVITAAGSFDDYADPKKVDLTHEGKVTRYNTEDIRKGKAEDPKVVPGDQIHVQKSFW